MGIRDRHERVGPEKLANLHLLAENLPKQVATFAVENCLLFTT